LIAIAVVAGVGPGLGFSIAKKFAAEYKVVLLSRSKDKLDSLANEIIKSGGEVDRQLRCTANSGNRHLDRFEQ
jgi:short-subunit dehydrogenase